MSRFWRMSPFGIRIMGIAVLLSTLFGGATAQASNSASPSAQRVTEFTAIDYACEIISEGTTIVDDAAGKTYTRGEIFRSIMTSDHVLLDNASTYLIFDSETDHETQETQVWVVSLFYPEMVDGTFVVPGQGVINETGPHVSHRGHGTHELGGMLIRFEANGIAPEDMPEEEPPCEPLFPSSELTGVIIDLGVAE